MSSLTKTVCFAEEMTRLVLKGPSLYEQLGLDKMWDSWDYKVLPADKRVVSLKIRIRGFPRVVFSTCHVMIGCDRRDDQGQCRIELKGNDAHSDAYWCMRIDSEMRYFGRAHLITEDEFGLDEDLAIDLNGFGVKTWLDLQMLSEAQVAEIFRPNPCDDPVILSHSDPAAYLAGEVYDKRLRLEPALSKMGVTLQGPRLSRAELVQLM